ncbi:hypothetical protein [Haloarcula halophila]|uniref:hypothetical protein n=1 Tax=Haloarcula TaxID=2237 RepID=UPI0023E35724|nr:hypothetical protein [Halomicroarcula sp. DFY41]
MSLNIGKALQDGFDRTVTRNGLLLIGVFVAFGALNTVISQSVSLGVQQWFQGISAQAVQQSSFGGFGAAQTVLAVPLPLPVVLLLALGTALLAEALRIVGIRAFAAEQTRSPTDPTLRNGLPLAMLNGAVGGTIATVLTYLGTALLILPGVFVALSFFFVRQEIALQNKNFVAALRDSWELSRGERLELFGLGALVFVVSVLASSPATVLFFLSPLPALALGMITTGITTVFGIAVATCAYQQLQEDDQAPRTGSTVADSTQDDTVGV